MKILVSAGGTGGHIYPALAIIDGFKKYDKNLEVLYVGTTNRMERTIVPKRKIEYYGIEVYGLSKNIAKDVKNLFLIRKAKRNLYKKMQEFKPDIVLGIGGYVTYPVLSVAKKLGIPTFIHEQNAIPGKTNKLISRYANKIGVSFKESAKYFPKEKVIYTGNPTGIMALSAPRITKSELGFDDAKPLIVVVSGSLGSSSVNAKMQEYLHTINKNYQVVYITGKDYYDDFVKEKLPSNIKVYPYFDNLTGLLKSADCLVTRAGASTIAEILALRVPSIFIPSPYVANNHQYYNALALKEANLALMIEEKDLTKDTISQSVESILNDKKIQEKLKKNLSQVETIDSVQVIYKAVRDLIKK